MTTPPTKIPTSKPEETKIKPLVNSEFYGVPITLVVGEAGSGKTFFCLNHPLAKSGLFLDLEDRYKTMIKFHPELKITQIEPKDEIKLGSFCSCIVYDKNYEIDTIATYENVNKMLDKAFKKKVKLIVIDGISDLRRMAQEKFEKDSGKTAYGFQCWGEINNIIKKTLYRLFNFARIEGIQVLLTTFFADVYADGERTGDKVIDVKDYIIARVDEVISLNREGTEFKIKRGKSPRGPSEKESWTLEGDAQ